MRMRGIGVVVGSMLLVGALSGSAVAEAPAEVGRYSTPESAQTVAQSARDTAFVVAVRAMLATTTLDGGTDADLVSGGKAVCANISAATRDYPMPEPVAFFQSFTTASVATYCPGLVPLL